MALIKEIILNNGISTNYHRVVSVNCVTNQCNIIEIASYTSASKREEEKEALKTGKEHNVFIETVFYNTEYNPEMTVISAYDYIKALPEFVDATDDLTEETTTEPETEQATNIEEVENNETIEQNV